MLGEHERITVSRTDAGPGWSGLLYSNWQNQPYTAWVKLTTIEPRGTVAAAKKAIEARARETLIELIEAEGFTVDLVDYCEDAETPGFLGQIAGATNQERRRVKIATKNRAISEEIDTLAHELRHVREPEWDCGNRDVLGRGGRNG